MTANIFQVELFLYQSGCRLGNSTQNGPTRSQKIKNLHSIWKITLRSRDFARTEQFYHELFGWKFHQYSPTYLGFEPPSGIGGGLQRSLSLIAVGSRAYTRQYRIAALLLPYRMIANTLSSKLLERVQQYAREWRLEVADVFETKTSAIAFASRGGQPLVLKVVKQQGDEWHSGEVLDAFGGSGVARVYEHTERCDAN